MYCVRRLAQAHRREQPRNAGMERTVSAGTEAGRAHTTAALLSGCEGLLVARMRRLSHIKTRCSTQAQRGKSSYTVRRDRTKDWLLGRCREVRSQLLFPLSIAVAGTLFAVTLVFTGSYSHWLIVKMKRYCTNLCSGQIAAVLKEFRHVGQVGQVGKAGSATGGAD